jgi:NitT/TauT family transport system substrate-binding protein
VAIQADTPQGARSQLAPRRGIWRAATNHAKEQSDIATEGRTMLKPIRCLPRGVALLAAAFALSLPSLPAAALDKLTFGTDWKAEAEHGGFYQAIATGIYAKHGIEVTLRPGGPQINQAQLLAAGQLDFNLASNSFIPLNFRKEGVPMVAVAALFQKDPQSLLAHPGQGNDSLAALKGKPIMVGGDTRIGSWLFLKAKFGYTDDQIRPYTFNIAPWLADPKAIQQGYVTSEVFTMQEQGQKPVVMLLGDNGYTSYAEMIETSTKLVAANPDLVQRFVDASIEGWYSFLYGDPAPANALIKKDNQEQTDALLAFGRDKMKEYGIVDSGDAKTSGIGAMTEQRWSEFFTQMSAQGVYPADMDWKGAYTRQFVNKKVGMKN